MFLMNFSLYFTVLKQIFRDDLYILLKHEKCNPYKFYTFLEFGIILKRSSRAFKCCFGESVGILDIYIFKVNNEKKKSDFC